MKKLLFALIGSGLLFAESEYNFIADPYFSPYSGAENLIVTNKLIERSTLPLTDLYQKNPELWARYARAAELYLFWNPVNYTSMVVQHEVFGHGYRVRNLPDPDAKVLKYTIGVPPPYGPGGGSTHFHLNQKHTTAFERLAIVTGGVEATAIGANRLRMQWLQKGVVNPKQSLFYLYSEHDLTLYAAADSLFEGGDINRYRDILNQTFSGSKLSQGSLAKQALINLLDPFTFYSFYSQFTYVSKGAPGPIPMIPIGSYKYLPGARLGLTPFGPEYYLENFLVKDDKPIYFYLRGGKHVGMNYLGLGIENPNQWQLGSFQIGYRVDLWQQPKIDMDDLRFALSEFSETRQNLGANTSASRLGASASLIVQKKLWDTGMLFVQCGGKTHGYVPGESLGSSLILRVGITLW